MSLITKQDAGLVRTVRARKARAYGDAVPSLVIVIDREMPVAREETRNRDRQKADALRLVEALETSLPAGTLGCIAEILIDKARGPVVSSARHRGSRPKAKVTNQE